MRKEEREFRRNVVQSQIGYYFDNPELIDQAFTRKSFGVENGCADNEVLEFIGDKALDIAVIRYLTDRFSDRDSNGAFICRYTEGQLTEMKKHMVEKKALASRVDSMGIANLLTLGKGDEKIGVNSAESVMEDLFEAIVGAVAVDSNWDFDEIQDVVEIMLNPEQFFQNSEFDYVSFMHNYCIRKYNVAPVFHYEESSFQASWYKQGWNTYCKSGITQSIPVSSTNMNELIYTAILLMDKELPAFRGFGRSKAESRKAVCMLAYNYLKEKKLLPTIADELEDPNWYDSISQLEILARRGYFEIPTYEYIENHDGNGNPIWTVKCHVEEEKYVSRGSAASKAKAKKDAAYHMLEYVLENYQ